MKTGGSLALTPGHLPPHGALPTAGSSPLGRNGMHRDQPRALLGDERIGAGDALLQLREHAALTRVVEGMGPGRLLKNSGRGR